MERKGKRMTRLAAVAEAAGGHPTMRGASRLLLAELCPKRCGEGSKPPAGEPLHNGASCCLPFEYNASEGWLRPPEGVTAFAAGNTLAVRWQYTRCRLVSLDQATYLLPACA